MKMTDSQQPTTGRKNFFSAYIRPAWGIRILLFLFVVTATAYSLVIPAGEGVDEMPHFSYIRYVQQEKKLPIQPYGDNQQPLRVWMGHHPPLYYAFGALVSFWVDTSDYGEVLPANPHFVWAENDPSNGWNVHLHFPEDRFPFRGTILAIHCLRLWSVVMGALIVLAVYKTTRRLLPHYPWVAVTAAGISAFHPALLFMSSTVHHDILMSLIYALSFWWMVAALRRPADAPPLSGWYGAAGGLLLGAGLLTKLSALSLLPLFGLTLLFVGRQRQWTEAVRLGAPLFAVGLALSGWWYWRNWRLYDDPLAWEMFLTVFAHMERQESYSWAIFRHEFLGQLYRTFWGAFGYMHITLPAGARHFFWTASGLAALAGIWAIIRRRRAWLSRNQWQAWVVLLAAIVLVLVSFVRLSFSMLGAGQGRYLMTLLVPLSLLLAVGATQWVGFRRARLMAMTLTPALFIYALAVLFVFVRPLYPWPETASPADIPPEAAVAVVYGDMLELTALELQPPVVAPGEAAELVMYWRALGSERPDLFLNLQLLDRYGNLLVRDTFWPIASSSTIYWDPADIYVSRRPIHLPQTALAGPGNIIIGVQRGREGEALPVQRRDHDQSPTVFPVTARFLIGRESVLTEEELAQPATRHILLGDQITLVNYDLTVARPEAGQPGHLDLALYWRTAEPLARNFTVFVHLIGPDGRLVSQQDNEPNAGQYPTSHWSPGDIISDPYRLPLPAGLPPGEYALMAGMYEWPSLERLPVTVDGVAAGDVVLLDKIRIE